VKAGALYVTTHWCYQRPLDREGMGGYYRQLDEGTIFMIIKRRNMRIDSYNDFELTVLLSNGHIVNIVGSVGNKLHTCIEVMQ
jgi:hypothetical protein